MESENNNNVDDVNWSHFVNIPQLSLYLPKIDLIQLSLTCKQYRLKLNPVIFRKLQLFKDDQIIPNKPNNQSKKKNLDILIDNLEGELIGKFHYFKSLIVWDCCYNNRFANKLFTLFTNLTRLELYCSSINNNYSSYSSLFNTLYPLKKLESLVMDSKLINPLEVDSFCNFKLPKELKLLKIIENFNNNNFKFKPIEVINGEYSNLKSTTVVNNIMLINITTLMNSLLNVKFLCYQYYCYNQLSKFFTFNPQLNSISIPLHLTNRNVINSILQLGQLNLLTISYSPNQQKNFNSLSDLATNSSIKHLNMGCNSITTNILIPILTSLQSLQILEFSEFDFWKFSDINWYLYKGHIPIFHLNGIWNANSNVDEYVDPKMFNKIRFSNMFELEYYKMYYGFEELDNWKVFVPNADNTREFWLIKKEENNEELKHK